MIIFMDYEKIFIYKYKNECINSGKEYNILPSFLMMMAITISDFGEYTPCVLSKNLYLLPTKDNYSKCYSLDSQKIYNNSKEAYEKEVGVSLISVYDNYNDSIKEFAKRIATTRRSENGPYKYQNLIGCRDYKEFIEKMCRDGLIEEYYHRIPDNIFIGSMINTIENYKLYELDSILEENSVSKRNRRNYKIDIQEVQETEEVCTNKEELMEECREMYRVMMDWNNPETQIFASPIIEDAIEEAFKHEGYKVYNSNGELENDPWVIKEEEQAETSNVKKLIIPQGGERVVLNKTPIYQSANSKTPFKYLSGDDFYYYDGSIVNNRAKITKNSSAFLIKNPILILGYIDLGE